MKLFIILTLILPVIYVYGTEDIPQHKIDKMYEAYKKKPIDPEELKEVQSLSSSEIYKQLLNASHSPSSWKEMRVMTIKERQNDLILEIHKTLEIFPLTIDTMGKLTDLASLVSPEFEAEIANKVLEHPSAHEFDIYFTGNEEFRDHFRTEPDLLKSALIKLLSEGRIDKNSAIHKKWEASISKFDRFQEQRDKRKTTIPTTREQTEQVSEARNEKANHEDNEKFPYTWLSILGILILLVVFALLFKVGIFRKVSGI